MLLQVIESIRWSQLLVTLSVFACIGVVYVLYLRPFERRQARNTALSADMQPLLAISQNASHVSSRLAIAAIDGNLNEDDINQHLMLLRESSPLVTRFPEVKEALETFVEISEAVSLEYSIKAPTEKITHALTILGVEYQRLDGVIGKVLFELDSEKT